MSRLVTFMMLMAAAGPAAADVRSSTFPSKNLGRDVAYVVQLPPSYAKETTRRYPVVYALHGLFEGEDFWTRRGLAPVLDRMMAEGAIPEMIIVAVDGGNSFFVNGPMGRYEDLVTRELVALVESTYRVRPGRGGRGLLGVSMGGYAALRIGLAQPALFGAVATHSAMLLTKPPVSQRGGYGHAAAFGQAFGVPLDQALWIASDPLLLAGTVDPRAAPALYFDCGASDRYGLAAGHRALDAKLSERGVAHRFALHPGDHGYAYVLTVLDRSLLFSATRCGSNHTQEDQSQGRSRVRGGPLVPRLRDCSRALVQKLRGEISSVWPGDRMELWIKPAPPEVLGVPQRLKDGPGQLVRKIDLALSAVREAHPDHEVTSVTNLGQARHESLQWLDGTEHLVPTGALPVLQQVDDMPLAPLLHERESPLGQAPRQHRSIANADRCVVIPVVRVEVRRIVILVVHPDHDSEKAADLRHGRILAAHDAVVGPNPSAAGSAHGEAWPGLAGADRAPGGPCTDRDRRRGSAATLRWATPVGKR